MDPGTPVRRTSDRGVWRNRPSASSANTPTLASARSRRYRLGAWVPVWAARSATAFGPAASASARRNLAATDRAMATHLPKIIWVTTASGGGATGSGTVIPRGRWVAGERRVSEARTVASSTGDVKHPDGRHAIH